MGASAFGFLAAAGLALGAAFFFSGFSTAGSGAGATTGSGAATGAGSGVTATLARGVRRGLPGAGSAAGAGAAPIRGRGLGVSKLATISAEKVGGSGWESS